ncbi:MAG: hypothetical protein AAGM21_04500 [Pseudomonadota bacterium]
MKDLDTAASPDDQARAILTANDRGGYTVPTDGLYPYQWNWDSAFAALGFATFDIGRAWAEVETLFTGQWDNGMVPHILFHKPDPGYFPGPDVWGCPGPIPSSGISQPPVAATFIRHIYDADPKAGRARLEALVPKLAAWHRWFMDWRSHQGAICITHPWEAGRDNAPDWDAAMAAITPDGVGEYQRRDLGHVDAAMRPTKEDYDRYIWLVQRGRRLGWDEPKLAEDRPFMVADPTMTFVLMRANRDLLALAHVIGHPTSEIEAWSTTLAQGADTLWNPDIAAYDSRDVRTGARTGTVSNASFLCWYAGLAAPDALPAFDRVAAAAPFGVPSYDPGAQGFDARRYWRGPSWPMLNMAIAWGLSEQGHTARAETLRASTATLLTRHGFYEYFDPTDGHPAGGSNFTWTAAIWLVWASPNAGDR